MKIKNTKPNKTKKKIQNERRNSIYSNTTDRSVQRRNKITTKYTTKT